DRAESGGCVQVEGTWRAHQVPLSGLANNPAHVRILEEWLRSYHPAELFDASGSPRPQILELVPKGTRRMGSNPHTNGGLLLGDLPLPPIASFAVPVEKPGTRMAESTRVLGHWLRDLFKATAGTRNFRLFGPDETASNRLDNVFEVTKRAWVAATVAGDT